MAKRSVRVKIDSCHNCPNATIKSLKAEFQHVMFCQTDTHCIRLREAWGRCDIPDWCPLIEDEPVRADLSKEHAIKARTEELNARDVGGHFYSVDQFIEYVEEGYILDDDGAGCFTDWNGNKKETVWCDVDWLNEHRANYPMIFWMGR